MEKISLDGLVIKTSPTAESDLILFILTRNKGVLRCFAKGARNTKSRLHAGAALFAYCEFTLFEKNGVYTVNEADIKDIFYELREDLPRLTLSQYFCEALLKTVPDDVSEPEYIRLMLNSLHLLCKQKKPMLLIKSVFELRLVSLMGYMPDLVACEKCGIYQTDRMYFNIQNGQLLCKDCGEYSPVTPSPIGVISAMRHIIYSKFEKCFSFDLPTEQLIRLNEISEAYMQNCLNRSFHTLDYFHGLTV